MPISSSILQRDCEKRLRRERIASAAAVSRFLIVTADDFGLCGAVNEAVEQANRNGILTAASLMISAPGADDAVRRARMLPDLRVGLHLVLADGTATLAAELIPALANTDGYMDEHMIAKSFRFFASPAVRRQLEAEVCAQFAAYARTGLALDHVNVHKHFHLHPTVLEVVLRMGRQFGMTALRVPDEPLWFAAHGGAWIEAAKKVALMPWIAIMKKRIRMAGVLCNDQIFGIAATGMMSETKLLAVLARLPPGITEIYLHPATQSGSLIATSMAGYRHTEEYAALLSPRLLAAVEATRAGCGGYADAPDVT